MALPAVIGRPYSTGAILLPSRMREGLGVGPRDTTPG